MTTARLSPAASLLRNSKLFALPPSVPLPPSKASSDVVPGSTTSTSVYPTKAAVETYPDSINTGDWGLKRALPQRSTAKSGTPVIRLRGGIDNEEHIADFASAGDHVVTLRKWQELNVQMANRPKWSPSDRTADKRVFSVFHPKFDNSTETAPDLSSQEPSTKQIPKHLQKSLAKFKEDREFQARESGQSLPTPPQPQVSAPKETRRWRYLGPWLAGMTDSQFDAYLKNVAVEKREEFRNHLKEKLKAQKEAQMQKAAANPETVGPVEEVSDEEVTQYLKYLRNTPKEFGPEIAAFLDLPEGPDRPSQFLAYGLNSTNEWLYARDTVATDLYKRVGPPRTHPSAGFSYVRTNQYSLNDPTTGPRLPIKPIPARLLKDSSYHTGLEQRIGRRSIGVAGVVARFDDQRLRSLESDQWKPQPGGTKLVAKVTDASVQSNGALEVGVSAEREWKLDETEVPFNRQEAKQPPKMPSYPRRMNYLDQPGKGGQQSPRYATKADEDTSDILAALAKGFGGSR